MSRPAATDPFPFPAWAVVTGLMAGTVLLYTRSLGYDFINYDDPGYVTANPRVRAGLTWDGVAWAFAGRSDYWHPLTWISHMLDWQLFGAKAAGHRFVSVLWHAVNAGLVFAVLRRFTGGAWIALFGAALFAWHPLRVESVVWVTERKDVMSGFFFLLMLLAHAGYADRLKQGRPAAGRYGLTLALFLGGLMCKPSLVTAPLVLLALDLWPLGRLSLTPAAGWWREHRRVLVEKLPFLALSAAISVATVVMQHKLGAMVLQLSLTDRVANALVSVVRYLGKFFWPADLVICYPHPGQWPWLVSAGALALVAGLSVLVWAQRRPRPWLLAGWVWYLALLLPTLGLIQVGFQAMADRFTYVAILGWQLALLLIVREWRLPALVRFGAGGLVLAACLAGTWRQQAHWRDSLTVWQHAVAVDERNHFAQAFLAYTHAGAGRWAEAETHARRALELSPASQWAWLSLAEAQRGAGRLDEAAETYARLLELNPGSARSHYARAQILLRLNRPAEAEPHFLRALQLSPRDPVGWRHRAETLAQQRRFAEAADAYGRWIALEPANAEAHAGLGYMFALTGRREEAARSWTEALRLQPDFPGLRERLERLRR